VLELYDTRIRNTGSNLPMEMLAAAATGSGS